MAMDTGSYSGKVDIWSLGITCIELGERDQGLRLVSLAAPSHALRVAQCFRACPPAERRPPRFKMNAMAALYQIPQAPPPTLTAPEKWPADMRAFVAAALVKEPAERPSASDLLQVRRCAALHALASFLFDALNEDSLHTLSPHCCVSFHFPAATLSHVSASIPF